MNQPIVRPKDFGAAAVRAVRRMMREYFTGTAAELAYYGLLSAVPCIAAFVGISNLALLFGMVLDLELRAGHPDRRP